MRLSWLRVIATFFLAAITSVPVWGDDSSTHLAVPGTLNYVEGQASIGGQHLNAKSIGSTNLEAGRSLATHKGKAEVLLTPGVFLRVNDDSAVKMISPSLTDTEVALQKGQAMVEIAEIHNENDLRIAEDGSTTTLLKTGLYDFDANQGEVRVFDGKALVQKEDQDVKVKGGREVNLNTTELKAHKFDKGIYEGEGLYRWSKLRSTYLAEASADEARVFVVNGWYGPGWFGAGWYWDPFFFSYTFIPANGIFYDPFGCAFYSPLLAYQAPWVYPGYYGQFGWGRPFRPGYRPTVPNRLGRGIPTARPGGFEPRASVGFGGFHGVRGFHGSGFHGGGFQGGGFHGVGPR